MKKILSLGIASAVLAATAVSASANVAIKTDDKVVNGATITVNFVADADGDMIRVKTEATGLELVSTTAPNLGLLVQVSDDKKGFANMQGFKANDVLFTQTYKVTAATGEKVSVNITELEGVTGDKPAVTFTVVAADGTSTTTPSGNDSGSSTTTPSGTDSGSSTTKPGDQSPATGVGLAVFPAVIAGAAVVVAKKKRG